MHQLIYPAAAALTALLALATNGCSQAALAEGTYGSAQLTATTHPPELAELVGAARAVKVTVRDGASGQVVATADFVGAELQAHLVEGTFRCTLDHLATGALHPAGYRAQVETFLEAEELTLLGAATSAPFRVTGDLAPAAVALPRLGLVSTPVGSAATPIQLAAARTVLIR